jgi:DNA-binding transcriptional LysR family regulator
MHQVELRHLRAFVTVVDAGGFGRAVSRLNVSQPALSRQIHALESGLGVRVFDRIGRRVQLTSEGEDMLRRARRLLADADSLGERARALKSGRTGIIRVGATPQAIETLLAGFLTRYRRRHPGVEIQLVEDGGGNLPTRLDRGEVHLSLMPAGDERFQWRALSALYVLAVFPETHRLGRQATLEIAELADTPLLLLRRDFGSRQWFDAVCATAHIRPRALLESGAPHTLIALVQSGYGIAIIPSNCQVPRRGVRVVPLVHRGVPIGRWASIAWDPRRFLPPYAEWFVEELVTYARHAHPGRLLLRHAPPLPPPRLAVAAGRGRSAPA